MEAEFARTTQNVDAILIDTEYTSWPGAMRRNWNGPGEHREVVQVAACGLSADCRSIVWQASWFTMPVRNPLLSEYFTELTGITQDQLASASIPLRSILNALRSRVNGAKLFSWGDGDESALRESCAIQSLSYSEFLPAIHDIRSYYSSAGIDVALYQSGTVHDAVGISLNGQQHNSMFDVQSMFEAIRVLVSSGRAAPLMA